MEVTLPRGVTLGVEAPNLDKSGDNDEKADRELARLFVEMFLPIEESVVLAFKNQRQAQKAKVPFTHLPSRLAALVAWGLCAAHFVPHGGVRFCVMLVTTGYLG